jgi:LSD1 subclass zinc finger protein
MTEQKVVESWEPKYFTTRCTKCDKLLELLRPTGSIKIKCWNCKTVFDYPPKPKSDKPRFGGWSATRGTGKMIEK